MHIYINHFIYIIFSRYNYLQYPFMAVLILHNTLNTSTMPENIKMFYLVISIPWEKICTAMMEKFGEIIILWTESEQHFLWEEIFVKNIWKTYGSELHCLHDIRLNAKIAINYVGGQRAYHQTGQMTNIWCLTVIICWSLDFLYFCSSNYEYI